MDGQKRRILDYIAEHGSITSLEAGRMEPPIIRPGSRICELRQSGFSLPKIHEKNEHTGVWYDRYFFSENDRELYNRRTAND